ncbi:glycosyltransferase family 4 protein [Aeromonas allosaccharophila]
MIKVILYQYRLLHYRVELFNSLREELAKSGVQLVLVYGQASKKEAKRKDEAELPWGVRVVNRFMSVAEVDVMWQPVSEQVKTADLCIFMQENRILSNYYLMLMRIAYGYKVAFWGHGRNYQSYKPTGLREKWKNWLLKRVDWWFAYTDITVKLLLDAGYDKDKITNLENAIDVTGFQNDLNSVTEEEIASAKVELAIPHNARIAIFCGSLYPEKKIDLLLASADKISDHVENFHLIVIGDGPSFPVLAAAAKSRPWLHCVGVKKGHDKAVLFKLGLVQLNPGLVGLHILDAFSAGLPMITTSTAMHSPEIAYLKNGINGIVVDGDSVNDYAAAVINLLNDDISRNEISSACLASAEHYTVENMVNNFSTGIIDCLKTYGYL